jgi:hypothetical protein
MAWRNRGARVESEVNVLTREDMQTRSQMLDEGTRSGAHVGCGGPGEN